MMTTMCAKRTARGGAAAATAALTILAGLPATASTGQAAGRGGTARRFPATFIAISPASGGPGRLAIYSTATGKKIRFLTANLPGGGAGGALALSANGRQVAFQRGQGSCAATIDTVPATGGRERVLVPMIGRGASAIVPAGPAYSGDGRYLLYSTFACSGVNGDLVHLRNLRTGRTVMAGGFITGAVFVNHDTQIAYIANGDLVVRRPRASPRHSTYRASPGCRYQSLAGTEDSLVAAVACGKNSTLRLVAISPRNFAVTRTLITLGSCLGSASLSLSAGSPPAILAQTYSACRPVAATTARIIEIRGHIQRLVRSGPAAQLPYSPVW